MDCFRFGRRRRGGFFNEVFGGVEAEGSRGFGVVEDGVDGGPGVRDRGFSLFTDGDGFFILGMSEGFAEAERDAAPIGNRVAVHAGGFGGCLEGRAADDGGNHLLLIGSRLSIRGLVERFLSFYFESRARFSGRRGWLGRR